MSFTYLASPTEPDSFGNPRNPATSSLLRIRCWHIDDNEMYGWMAPFACFLSMSSSVHGWIEPHSWNALTINAVIALSQLITSLSRVETMYLAAMSSAWLPQEFVMASTRAPVSLNWNSCGLNYCSSSMLLYQVVLVVTSWVSPQQTIIEVPFQFSPYHFEHTGENQRCTTRALWHHQRQPQFFRSASHQVPCSLLIERDLPVCIHQVDLGHKGILFE